MILCSHLFKFSNWLIAVSFWMLFLPALSMAGVPVANFTASSTCVALGGSVTFTDASTPFTPPINGYTWTFPGGAPPSATTQSVVVVTYTVAGVYNVTLTVSDAGGTSTPLTKTGYIKVGAPSVNLGTDVTVQCFANTLDAGNTGTSYAWATGETTQTILPSASGTYSVTVTNCNGSSSDNIIVTIDYTNCSTPSSIAAGGGHNLALCDDNTLWAWGPNANGQLGDNTTATRNAPVRVLGGASGSTYLSGIIAVAAGGGQTVGHSLAVRNDGTVWAWGKNSSGQLGDNTTTQRNTPIQVLGGASGATYLTGITAVIAGPSHSLALKNDNTLWSWGENTYGQLGNNTTVLQSTPVQVMGGASGSTYLTGIITIGSGSGSGCSFAVKNDGTVWSWGENTYGQLGNNTTVLQSTPVQVLKGAAPGSIYLTGVTAITGGQSHSLAVRNDGTVWTWGLNGYGMGTGIAGTYTPVQVLGGASGSTYLTGITSVSGSQFSLAMKNDGTVWGWGRGENSQLGNNGSNSTTPVQVHGAGNIGFLTGITAIEAGSYHSISLKSDGTIWSWGWGNDGSIGDGAQTSRSVPVQTPMLCMYPLPIELLSFSAVCLGDKAEIRWVTASETNNDYFTIERAINLQGFQNLAGLEWKVVGAVQGAGNSSAIKRYSFIDTDIPSTSTPQPSTLLYYRLKQTDYDGRYEYFNPVASHCRQNAEGITIINIYPNPANATVEFTVSSAENTGGSVAIMDALGRTILKNKLSIQKGLNRFSLDISALSSAVYLIQVKTDTGLHRDQKQLCVE